MVNRNKNTLKLHGPINRESWTWKRTRAAGTFQIKLRPISSYICLWFQFALHCKSEVRVMLYILMAEIILSKYFKYNYLPFIFCSDIFFSLQKIRRLVIVFPVSCWNDLENKVYDNTSFHLKIVDQAMGLNDKWNNWA